MFKLFKTTKSPKFMILAVSIFASSTAFADGFVCESQEESLKVQVYNHTEPTQGTRNPAVMVISDPSRAAGKRTLAVFRSDEGELFADGSRFYAFSADSRLDQLSQWDAISHAIAGLEELEIMEVSLTTDFSYNRPVPNGAPVDGVLELVLKSGDLLWLEMDCKRYLKN